MSPALLAVASSICFAGAFVTGKRGLAGTSLVATILITFGAAWSVTVVVALASSPLAASPEGIALFVATGLIAPGIGYAAALAGVDRMGPSISVPIQQGARPVISVSAAALLLGESVGALRIAGILAILVGSVGLARQDASARIEEEPAEGAGGGRRLSAIAGSLRPGLVFPFTAAVSFAAFDILVKHSLDVMDDPALGAALTLGAGFLAWAVLVASLPRLRRSFAYGRSVAWVGVGGLLFGLAALSVFHALRDGSVSLVSPILASQPLLVFVLSRIALRDIESVTLATVLKGALVVAGTLLVVA